MRSRKISLFVGVLLLSGIGHSHSLISYRKENSETAAADYRLFTGIKVQFEKLPDDLTSLSLNLAFEKIESFRKSLSQQRDIASRQEEDEEVYMERLKMSLEMIPSQASFQAKECGEYSFRIKQDMDGQDDFEKLHPITKTTLNVLWKLCEKGGS